MGSSFARLARRHADVPRPGRHRRRLVVAITVVALLATMAAPAAAVLPQPDDFGAGIEPYARYEGQTQCLDVEQPGVRAFRDLIMAAYPDTGRGNILRGCGSGGRSEHKDGRAWDWMVRADNPTHSAIVDEVLAWLLATDGHGNRHAIARRLGIMYIIWDGQVWESYRADQGWRPYTGAHPHDDHVHFSFGWFGAHQKTSFWTSGPLEPGPFPDVPKGSIYDEAVTWVKETAITLGDQHGDYRPGDAISRAQMASMLWRLMGEPADVPPAGFEDVGLSGPHSRAIDWLAASGITVGDASGAFRPTDSITRGQMASMLWRLVGQPGGAPRHAFVDVPSVHGDAVSWLAANEITLGRTPDEFEGEASVTRGQLALFLHRLTGMPQAWEFAEPVSPVVRF